MDIFFSYLKEIHEGDKSNHAIQYCLNYFGCRTNAMINLKWEHINFINLEMTLLGTKIMKNDSLNFVKIKKDFDNIKIK